jgi:hypothetical protein
MLFLQSNLLYKCCAKRDVQPHTANFEKGLEQGLWWIVMKSQTQQVTGRPGEQHNVSNN